MTSSDEDSTQAVSGFRQDRGRLLMAKGNMQKGWSNITEEVQIGSVLRGGLGRGGQKIFQNFARITC